MITVSADQALKTLFTGLISTHKPTEDFYRAFDIEMSSAEPNLIPLLPQLLEISTAHAKILTAAMNDVDWSSGVPPQELFSKLIDGEHVEGLAIEVRDLVANHREWLSVIDAGLGEKYGDDPIMTALRDHNLVEEFMEMAHAREEFDALTSAVLERHASGTAEEELLDATLQILEKAE